MGFLDHVKKAHQEAIIDKQKENEISEDEDRRLREKERVLVEAVNNALMELGKVEGVKVDRTKRTVVVGGNEYRLDIEQVVGKSRLWDEGPEEPYTAYVVRWYDSRNEVYGGNSTPESFEQEFGRFVGRRLA